MCVRQLDDDDEGTDVWAFVRGYITVTSMTLDVTDNGEMKALAYPKSDQSKLMLVVSKTRIRVVRRSNDSVITTIDPKSILTSSG